MVKATKKKLGRVSKKATASTPTTPPATASPPEALEQDADGWGEVQGGEGEDVADDSSPPSPPPPPAPLPPPPATTTTTTQDPPKMTQQPQQQIQQTATAPQDPPAELVNAAEMLNQVFSGKTESFEKMGQVFTGMMSQMMNPAAAAGVQETLDINKLSRNDMLEFGKQIGAAFERAPVSMFADLERWKSGLMSQMSQQYAQTLHYIQELIAPAFVLVPHPLGVLVVSTQNGPVSGFGWEQLDVLKTLIRTNAQQVIATFTARPPQATQQTQQSQHHYQQPQQQQTPYQQPQQSQHHYQQPQQQQTPYQQPQQPQQPPPPRGVWTNGAL